MTDDNYLKMICGGEWRNRVVAASTLSTRAKTVLRRENLTTAGEVAKLSPRQIICLEGCGKTTAIEIIFWLLALCILEEAWR